MLTGLFFFVELVDEAEAVRVLPTLTLLRFVSSLSLRGGDCFADLVVTDDRVLVLIGLSAVTGAVCFEVVAAAPALFWPPLTCDTDSLGDWM